MASGSLRRDGRKRIVIVGGGAAGMSCAATLAQHPDKFQVTILERMPVTGGQATSISIDRQKYGADWLNDGVQGGSPIFRHTFKFFKDLGHEPREIKLQVSFGKGKDGFWSNVFPSPLIDEFSADIKKFGRVLKIIKWTMPILGLVPIRIMLRMFFFSKGFGDKMVYPLMALFLGTGNQTANVACAILERLFDDPNMKLWDYDEHTLLPNLPTMVTFPKLDQFYKDWAADLSSKGVDIRLNTDVTAITRSRTGVSIESRPYHHPPQDRHGTHTGSATTASFDDLVICVLADDALRILGPSATWRERLVLGGARFFDDVTVTHSDSTYFNIMYETRFKEELCAAPKSARQAEQVAFARGDATGPDGEQGPFRPMYFTHSYAADPTAIEMSFDCSHYQHQFREAQPTGRDGDGSNTHKRKESTTHVYQSIFLDESRSAQWTMTRIEPSTVIARKWWHQLGHGWRHYVRVVPGMMFVQARPDTRTLFAGSWTLVNMHELACTSGIAAAVRLGAEYVEFDDFATTFFRNYLALTHGVWWWRRRRRRQRENKKTR